MNRLLNRSTETKDEVIKRLERYDMELQASFLFDVIVENIILQDCIEQIKSIINQDKLFK